MSQQIHAAGGVLWRQVGAGREVALVHRPRYGDWSLPKGKLERAEPHLVGAMREIGEETGFAGAAGPYLGSTAYDVLVDGRSTPKSVRWWSVRATEGAFTPSEEVDELRWLAASDAAALLHAGPSRDAEVLARWRQLPDEPSVVLLVRHGSAGDPEQWQGDDDDRPLDERGVEQAATAAQVLALYRPSLVVSAPPVRCLDTVRPLAALLGLAVDVDPLLGEVGAPAAPQQHVIDLAAAGTTVVLASQGGVIPRVVAALDPDRTRIRARKGSVWAITLAGREPVSVHDEIQT